MAGIHLAAGIPAGKILGQTLERLLEEVMEETRQTSGSRCCTGLLNWCGKEVPMGKWNEELELKIQNCPRAPDAI